MAKLDTALVSSPALLESMDRLSADSGVSARQNRLLASLPDEDYIRLAPYLGSVELRAGEQLSESGTRQRYVYFPVSSVLSLQCILEDGASCEIAAIGREGLFSASLLMDEATASSEVLVQSSGLAFRCAGHHFEREFQRGAAFQRLVLRHMQTLFMQVAQTSTCNRGHSVEQRVCRWLLGMLERGAGTELRVTQERLGCILGVRRESVTEAAGRLQEAGVISYRRGRVSVLAPRALAVRACSCHGALKQLYERSLDLGHGAEPFPARTLHPIRVNSLRPTTFGSAPRELHAAAR